MTDFQHEGLNANDEMLLKYLEGLLSPEQRLQIESMVKQTPELQGYLESLVQTEKELQQTGSYLRNNQELVAQTGEHLRTVLFESAASSSASSTVAGNLSSWIAGIAAAGFLGVVAWFLFHNAGEPRTSSAEQQHFRSDTQISSGGQQGQSMEPTTQQQHTEPMPQSKQGDVVAQTPQQQHSGAVPEHSGVQVAQAKNTSDSLSISLVDAPLAKQIREQVVNLRARLENDERVADTIGQIKTLRSLATLLNKGEHFEESLEYYNRCIELCSALGATETEALLMGESALVLEKTHNRKEALRRLELCVQLLRSAGSDRISYWENTLGKIKNE